MTRKLAWWLVMAIGTAVLACPTAEAFEFRTRPVRWNGSAWVPLCNDALYAAPGTTHRLRLEIGVFDDATGPAPAGGFIGWNVGTVSTTGGTNSRTPGCLPPFYVSPDPSHADCDCQVGSLCPDPFTTLNNIDVTRGLQGHVWGCGANGFPLAPPPATVQGLNSYVQIFEMTTVVGPGPYSITFAGALIAATQWNVVGTPVAPNCGIPADPSDDVPGSVGYAAFPTEPRPFTHTFNVSATAPVDCLGDGVPDDCELAFTERLYSLTGTSAGTPWSWRINSSQFPSVSNPAVPGVPAGQSAFVVATAFANSINVQACPDAQLFASAYLLLGTTYLVVSVAGQVTGDTPFDLCVGPSGGPASCCPVMAFSSCSFNPTMTRIPTSGADCNANGHDDTIDILSGRSADTNNDGIPDDCQPPQCPADFNQSGSVDSQDFFDFLAAFFRSHPAADFNHDTAINSQDFFDFLAAFFAGY